MICRVWIAVLVCGFATRLLWGRIEETSRSDTETYLDWLRETLRTGTLRGRVGMNRRDDPILRLDSYPREVSMNGPTQSVRHDPRWPPALAILAVLLLVASLRGHVFVIPVGVSYLAAFVALTSMAAVWLTNGHARWLRIERAIILFWALVYVANTLAELADMLGVVPVHPPGGNAFSLLSSSVAIWVGNVLAFSLLFWQIDRGGPGARASGASVRPDWVFPQPAAPEDLPAGWRPFFVDYLFLAYNTATSFSPADVSPLTRRAKLLMMAESMTSLLTTLIVLARGINALPS